MNAATLHPAERSSAALAFGRHVASGRHPIITVLLHAARSLSHPIPLGSGAGGEEACGERRLEAVRL